MAYQPVFVTITDVNGTRQSYSCRQKVTWVDTNIYFASGARVQYSSSYDPSEPDEVPCIQVERSGHGGDASIHMDISGLLGTNTELYLGGASVNLRELAQDPEATLAKLIAKYIEHCA